MESSLSQKKHINFELVSQEKLLFSGKVYSILTESVLGQIEILPGHTPCLIMLKQGIVKIKTVDKKEKKLFYISGGVLETQQYQATILASIGKQAEDLNESEIEKIEKKAYAELAKNSHISYSEVLAELSIAKSQKRIIQELNKNRR